MAGHSNRVQAGNGPLRAEIAAGTTVAAVADSGPGAAVRASASRRIVAAIAGATSATNRRKRNVAKSLPPTQATARRLKRVAVVRSRKARTANRRNVTKASVKRKPPVNAAVAEAGVDAVAVTTLRQEQNRQHSRKIRRPSSRTTSLRRQQRRKRTLARISLPQP